MRPIFSAILIAVGVGLTILADIFLKKSNFSNWSFIVLGAVLYMLVALPVAVAYKYMKFGDLFFIWEGIFIVLGIIIATIFYKEPFTAYRLGAIVLALGALYLSYK